MLTLITGMLAKRTTLRRCVKLVLGLAGKERCNIAGTVGTRNGASYVPRFASLAMPAIKKKVYVFLFACFVPFFLLKHL